MSDIAEPDRTIGAPHPRDTQQLIGQDHAMHAVLEAFHSGRFHSGWMLTGPKGIGKATLAYKMAAFLLTQEVDGGMFTDAPATSLMVEASHPIHARISAQSEAGLFVLKRPVDEKTGKAKQVIPVDSVRKVRDFFGLSAGGNGRRVVIVDAADELNPSAANALLKMLEEPPKNAVMILVTHQPSRILPTLRSRCRVLPCAVLSQADMQVAFEQACPDADFSAALYPLTSGSVGAAVELSQNGGLEIYADWVGILSGLPDADRSRVQNLQARVTGPTGPQNFAQIIHLLDQILSRMARSVFGLDQTVQVASGEREAFARLCSTPRAAQIWAALQHELGQTARQAAAVNLDPAAVILDMVLKLEDTARSTTR